MFPFLSPSDASRRTLERMVELPEGFCWAQLTGRSGNEYAWKRQMLDSDSGFYDDPAGVVGTVNGVGGETQTSMPARMPNSTDVLSTPTYALLKRGLGTAAKNLVWFVVTGGAGSTVEIGEPHNSGAIVPTNYADWRLVILDVASGTFSAGANVWVKDANA